MAINWEEVDSLYSNFKAYVEDGTYKVKLEKVELGKVTQTGSFPLNFIFQEEKEIRFPKVTEWISFKEGKEKWRYHRMSQLIQFLGKNKADAHKVVEFAESKSGNENIAKGYEVMFNRVASVHPEVEIEVTTELVNGKEYTRGDWTDKSVRMNDSKKATEQVAGAVLNEGETATVISSDDVPF